MKFYSNGSCKPDRKFYYFDRDKISKTQLTDFINHGEINI